MDKTFTKGLFLLLLPLLVITAAASAQTITVGAIDPGPYGRGSSITLPFHIDNTSGCIAQNNTFRLVLSDANGVFPATPTVLTTKTGFYETFLNGTIPLNIPAGAGYRLRIESTSAPNSLPSNTFIISTDPAITAAVSSTEFNGNPEVFGACVGTNNTSYPFINKSTAGTTVTASFFNEITQASEGTQAVPANFNAKLANYTVLVKATNGVSIGVKSYTLINNDIYRTIGNSGNNTACANGTTPLTFPIPSDDGNHNNTGFKYNYPGLLYTVNWGDGSTPEVYTYCDIVKQNNSIGHLFTTSSCGNNIENQKNVFKVELTPKNPFCNATVTPGVAFAKVVSPPKNIITGPENACTNTEVTFTNGSYPGEDPNSISLDCKNTGALYSWYINGVAVELNKKITDPFVHKFLTHGSYTVTLKLQNPTGCPAADRDFKICIQDPPIPKFDIPLIRCLSDAPLTPVDQSVVDIGCDANTPPSTYSWVQTAGPVGGVTFNATSKTPSFTFHVIGVYKFRLDITTANCARVSSVEHTIVVNDAPQAKLADDYKICGQGSILSFDPTATLTKSGLTGTAQPLATTYTWTVTGGAFAFVGGTDLHSQYPKIRFDDLAAYTITATHVNNCGVATDTQILTFVQSPNVVAGTYAPVCQSISIPLNGTPGVGGLVTGVTWQTATGGTFVNAGSPNAIYTPSAADNAAGQVTLTYRVTTSLAAPCNVITDQTTITIIKTATVTSANTASVCSGTNFNYTITAANPATTFNWTTTLTSGTATGFGPSGSSNTINDLITNTGNTDAVITYTIKPTLNGCPGTPFLLRLTVHPLPVFTPPVTSPICSGQPANITLTSNINPTTYTWTVVAANGITGAVNHPTPTTVASIQDILVNTSGIAGTVTYTITPYNGTCPGTSKPVTITVNPAAVTADAGPDQPVFICSATYPLQGNNPSPGTGVWSPVPGITFSDKNDPHAIASGLLPGQTYRFTWTITAAVPGCPPTSDFVTVTRSPAAVGGTTATTTPTVCAGTNVVVTLTGQVGTIVWQQSINGGTNWTNIPAQTTATLTYPAIAQTTQFRAVVSSGACAPDNSTVTTITVVQPPPAANAGTYTPLCNLTFTTLTANNPGAFTGKWTREPDGAPPANIVNADNFTTQVTGLLPGNTYKFRWTIFANAPCTGDQTSVATIIVGTDLTPDFHPSKTQLCGSGSIIFTNTTADVPGTVYEWNFDDSSPVSHDKNPSHLFQPNADKTDVIRNVSLTITSNCTEPHTIKVPITISPDKPDAHLRPPTDLRSCGDLNLSVENASLGTNDEYTFHLVDEHGVDVVPPVFRPRGDKSSVTFQTAHPDHIATWHLYVDAKNNCDVTQRSVPIDIPVSPSNIASFMQIKDNPPYVCLGTPVFFTNISTGGESFKYNIYDVDQDKNLPPVTAGLADLPYIFPHAGHYQVTITASNTGCGDARPSPISYIEVIPLPQPIFGYTVDADNKVKFVNQTPGAGSTPSASLSYVWNFGDGTASEATFKPNDHVYDYTKSPYTVTLTATNPGTTCQNIFMQTIEIKFTGELFLPNAFQPASSKTELRTFKAKGQKLKEWRMQVFNNWGQLIWQTTALNSNGEPTEGWDGTFKGAPAQQGVYVWQITAKFLNGSDWKGMSYNGSLPKRAGPIHLIR